MKKTKWMVGSVVTALMALPIACGGQDTAPGPVPGPEGEVGEAEGAWGIELVSASTSDCATNLLFEISAAEAIDFVAVEANEELQDQMQLTLLRVNEQNQLEQVDLTAMMASSLVRDATAMSRAAQSASQSEASAATASERSVADVHSFQSATSEALQESAVARTVSASATQTAANDYLEEHETIVDQTAAAEIAASDEASAQAFQSLFDWEALGIIGWAGIGAGGGVSTAAQDVEAAQAAQAAQFEDMHLVNRDVLAASSSQTSAANEYVAEEAAEKSLVASQEIAELDETAVYEAASATKQEATAFSESIVETAESVYEALSQTESLDQHALESTKVFLTDSLAQDRLYLQVAFAAQEAGQAVAVENAVDAASVHVLTGTTGGVFADAVFPGVLACVVP